MTNRASRSALALFATFSLTAALAGGAIAGKPADPGSQGKGKGKAGMKYGVLKPKGGTTLLTIDPALSATLSGVPVTVSGLPENQATTEFKITKARITLKKANKGRSKKSASKTLSGFVNHSGGLKFERGAQVVTLSNLRINLSAAKKGTLEGNVNGGTDRVRLGVLSGVSVDAMKSISATVTLTQRGADALNSGLSLGGALSSTTVLGVVKITPTF